MHCCGNAKSSKNDRAHVLEPPGVFHSARELGILERRRKRRVVQAQRLELVEAVTHDMNGVDTEELDARVLVRFPTLSCGLVPLQRTSMIRCTHRPRRRKPHTNHGIEHWATICDEEGLSRRNHRSSTNLREHFFVFAARVSADANLSNNTQHTRHSRQKRAANESGDTMG